MQVDHAKNIGKRISTIRKQKQLTQAQLADGIGTQAQISKIEKGLVIPLATTLYDISKKLEVDMNIFFEKSYTERSDYLKEVKDQIRKEIRNRNYEEVESILNFEGKNNVFKSDYDYQFFLWHKGVVTYYIYQNVDKSIEFLEEALKLNSRRKEAVATLQDVEILNSIAIIYNEIKEYKTSIIKYKRALSQFKETVEITDRKIEIRLYYGLAKSLFKDHAYHESIEYCKKGINLCISEESLYLLGELYYEQGQNYQALTYNKRAHHAYLTAKELFQIDRRPLFVKVVEEKLASLK